MENGQALINAVLRRDMENIQEITQMDPDAIKFQNHQMENTLHVAIKRGDIEIIKLLLAADPSGQSIQVQDIYGNTPLHKAVRHKSYAIMNC